VAWSVTVVVMAWAIQILIVSKSIVWVLKTFASTVINFGFFSLENKINLFLISNFRNVLNVVCFLPGNSPASEFYSSTFQNTLFHLHGRVGMKND